MTVAAITGIASGLGPALLSQLEVDPDISQVVGLDVRDAPAAGEKLVYHRRSVTEPFDELFAQHRVTCAVHLAFEDDPRDRARAEAVNLGGTRNFLAACHAAKVETVVLLSSAAAYGARPDNPEWLFEGAPLRAGARCPAGFDHARMEALAYEYVSGHPDVRLVIVRPAPIVGPTTGGVLGRLVDAPLLLAPLGVDPVLQLVHEDDATRCIHRLIKTERVGVFNLAADGFVTLSQVARLVERSVLRLPTPLLRLLLWAGRRLGLLGLDRAPPGLVDHALHPTIMAATKVRTEVNFAFRYDTPRALLDWVEARGGGAPPAPRPEEPEELDDDELLEEPPAAEPEPAAGIEPAQLLAPPSELAAARGDAPAPVRLVPPDESPTAAPLAAAPDAPPPGAPAVADAPAAEAEAGAPSPPPPGEPASGAAPPEAAPLATERP